MIAWIIASVAHGAEPWWRGAWGLDPSQSDDPGALLDASFRGGGLTPSASRLAPDGAADAAEETFDKARTENVKYVSRSGRVAFATPQPGTVDLEFDQALVPGVSLEGGWTKVEDADLGRYKVRLWDRGDELTVERRFRGMSLYETWIAPTEAGAEERVVVVQLQGATLSGVVEFRRVYRRLD